MNNIRYHKFVLDDFQNYLPWNITSTLSYQHSLKVCFCSLVTLTKI